jgi:tRNA threonylcarbamoyladenosine biosynthesis protein TsaB
MLLAIDTSTRMVSIALYDGARVHSEMSWISHSYHTVELAPAVADMLTKATIAASDLSALGVAMGPGSFTALRIGLALAKGIVLSEHIPLIGIPTLDVLAASQPLSDLHLAAILQAGRKRVAIGWYLANQGSWQSTGELENMTLDEFADNIRQPTLVCGELNAEMRQRLGRKFKNVQLASPAQSMRRSAYLAELAWNRWQAGETDNPALLSPIYLHHGDPIPG